MQYDIEPLNVTGTNELGRTLVEGAGDSLNDVEKEALEEVLQSIPSSDGFHLSTKLAIPLEAKVLRGFPEHPRKEIVRLSSGDRHVDLLRDVAGMPGDIGVSCSPDGNEVPVETLNIEFRDYDDAWTDRGIIWVSPGDPATMSFFVKAQALKNPGAVMEIITAAEEAIKTKVLTHFPDGK